MAVAQWAERGFPIDELPSSYPFIGNFSITVLLLAVNLLKKQKGHPFVSFSKNGKGVKIICYCLIELVGY